MKTKHEKRLEAEKRHEEYDKLTTSQKIKKLNDGGYRAEKERKKLGEIDTSTGEVIIPDFCTR